MADLLVRLNAALGDRWAVERKVGSGGVDSVCLPESLKHHSARLNLTDTLRME